MHLIPPGFTVRRLEHEVQEVEEQDGGKRFGFGDGQGGGGDERRLEIGRGKKSPGIRTKGHDGGDMAVVWVVSLSLLGPTSCLSGLG
ncbi:unnamed protein product [Linum trigynum]|uniref:Uncharacterized protein n=1 Tax=Linum trigynum TaxID=586398 RepID=A0AAV2E401_9ROSI